ncbi:SMP-30/gluconolactonase/LRE family protein [Kibdelosporangium philippinense]|uniref:SMP-30/gluconolactonase/LRE family protein n=1 Tax=Kibdelosporangium philippinense TaxID=211113 RepID=A0ABS8Z7V7_9PSEU|nr:SMP-30/gluconolactonase/LRE family protein [Kibdelosporangium philippinense]MCE7003487.1 SMP-30/gluconolactonase/LRE family protein [Kibdelosporangium philippinense]
MRRRVWRSVVLALITVAAIPVPASAARPCPDFILGNGPTLHPEGVAYDHRNDRFLVGSVTHGTVSTVQPDGSARTLVNDPKLITTMGIAVDRGTVLAVNGDIGRGDRSTPDTINKTAGLGFYDLRSGRQIRYVDLGALDPQRAHFGNDVAVAPDGTAYVTDSRSGAIYRVPTYGSPSILVHDDRLMPAGSGNGANGIVWHPSGFLLVAHSSGRSLWRIPLRDPANLAQVTVNEPIGALDGLLLTGANTLDGIDNTSANRLLRLNSKDGWRTATVSSTKAWPDPAPTTMARSRCGTYVLTGRLDLLLSGTKSDEFRLRRLDYSTKASDQG